jgi:hypothetical protein
MLGEWMGISSLVAVNVASSFGIYKYFQGKIDELSLKQDEKVARMYARLDEVKDNTEKCFIRKDICGVMHQQTASNLKGLEDRIEKRFDKIELKLEQVFTTITALFKK